MRDDEIETLNQMRNKVLYDGYKNSIVEWTLSDEWSKVEPSASQKRGTAFMQHDVYWNNEFHGEIDAR